MPIATALAVYLAVAAIGLAITLTADRTGDEYQGVGAMSGIFELMIGGRFSQVVATVAAFGVGMWLALRQSGPNQC